MAFLSATHPPLQDFIAAFSSTYSRQEGFQSKSGFSNRPNFAEIFRKSVKVELTKITVLFVENNYLGHFQKTPGYHVCRVLLC